MKGKNFTEEEDMRLCRAYLAVAKDPTTSTNQSAATLRERITNTFNGSGPDGVGPRQYRSLERKWGAIQRDVNKFCGYYATVRGLNVSGTSEDDTIDRAMKLYESKDPKKKAFKFLHCWRVLRNVPKWEDFRSSSRPRVDSIASSASVTSSSDSNQDTRPQGVKAAKASEAAAQNLDANVKRMATASITLAANSTKRIKLLEKANMLVLFPTPLASLDSDAREYYATERKEILDARRAARAQQLAADRDS